MARHLQLGKKWFSLLCGAGLLLSAVGCGDSKNNTASNNGYDGSDIGPTSANFVYADTWDEMDIQAYQAKTVLSTAAHFSTDRNACGKAAFGVLTLDQWNAISQDVNAFMHSTPLAKSVCYPQPDNNRMDGTVDLVGDTVHTVHLLETKDGSTCSFFSDSAASQRLITNINALVILSNSQSANCGYATQPTGH